jgi:broad specificity phosphatase PhoE
MTAVRRDPALVDPNLHPIGEMQCDQNANKAHKINFTRVFVSPMKRAM